MPYLSSIYENDEQDCKCSATDAYCSLVIFKCIRHNSFKENIEESRREQTSLFHPNCGFEPFSNISVEVNGTAGLVVEVPYDADGVSVNIVVVHCRAECSRPQSVECLLEVYKYMIEILLMLEISLAQNPEVEYLFSCAASCSEPACSSATISSAWGFNLFNLILSITLLE